MSLKNDLALYAAMVEAAMVETDCQEVKEVTAPGLRGTGVTASSIATD